MALKALMLRKKIDDAKKALNLLREKDAEFATRKAQIAASIEEAETEEERKAVEEAVEAFDAEEKDHDEAKANLEREIGDLEADLEKEEAEQDTTPEPSERKGEKGMVREFEGMNTREAKIAQIVKRENVQAYLGEVRAAIKEKRALTNVGLTVPQEFIGFIRENIMDYSKMYKHVNVVQLSGDGKAVVMGTIPEAVWTECCANINELSIGFNDITLGCYMVAGFYAVCNATLEDSDIDLAAELIRAIGAGIGLALDKAILYGTGNGMPLGIAPRIGQTQRPANYPATARDWVNLSASNAITIPASATGKDLFKAIIVAAGAAKGRYSRGVKVWAMNEETYTKIVSEAVSVDASGAIVAGVNGVMPGVGGAIEVLDFIPTNNIAFGFFDLYLLGERAGQKFMESEHYRFLQSQTVFKGTARYDGQPAIAEAFVLIGIGGTAPSTSVTFPTDTANQETPPATEETPEG